MGFPSHARGLLYAIGAACGLAYMGAVWEACNFAGACPTSRFKAVIGLGAATAVLCLLALLVAVGAALSKLSALPEVVLALLALVTNTIGLGYIASQKTAGAALLGYLVVPVAGEIAILAGLWFALFEGVLGLGNKSDDVAEAVKSSAA